MHSIRIRMIECDNSIVELVWFVFLYESPFIWVWYGFQMVRWGPFDVCLVVLEALHALSYPIGASLLRPTWVGTITSSSIRTHHTPQF